MFTTLLHHHSYLTKLCKHLGTRQEREVFSCSSLMLDFSCPTLPGVLLSYFMFHKALFLDLVCILFPLCKISTVICECSNELCSLEVDFFHFHPLEMDNRNLSVFNALLTDCNKITATQYWFSDRDFFSFCLLLLVILHAFHCDSMLWQSGERLSILTSERLALFILSRVANLLPVNIINNL